MPIADLQDAAQKIAGFLANLNKLGGMRLKYRITAGDGTPDPLTGTSSLINVELGGPDVTLVTQHNGELLRALETIAAQILRLDQREGDLVSFDAANLGHADAGAQAEGRDCRRQGDPLRRALRVSAR
jgi:spoIIIJ-associated protein